MDESLKKKEKELEMVTLDEQIEEKRATITQKKMLEKEMKAKYGFNWKKILGVTKINSETLHSLYSFNPELKELNRPKPSQKWS